MGIFKSRWSEETSLVTSFQMIAVAIDVSAHAKISNALNIEVGDLWALYFSTIEPLKNSEIISQNMFKLLKYAPGNPMKPNLTETHKSPSSATFRVNKEDLPIHAASISELSAHLKSKYMQAHHVVDDIFAKEFSHEVIHVLRTTMPDRVSSTTTSVAYIFALALRSILKESESLRRTERDSVRNSGIFWISMMIIKWHFKE